VSAAARGRAFMTIATRLIVDNQNDNSFAAQHRDRLQDVRVPCRYPLSCALRHDASVLLPRVVALLCPESRHVTCVLRTVQRFAGVHMTPTDHEEVVIICHYADGPAGLVFIPPFAIERPRHTAGMIRSRQAVRVVVAAWRLGDSGDAAYRSSSMLFMSVPAFIHGSPHSSAMFLPPALSCLPDGVR